MLVPEMNFDYVVWSEKTMRIRPSTNLQMSVKRLALIESLTIDEAA
jgi:hypothetical protein